MTRAPVEDRWINLGPGTTRVPERLLLAHANGEVLFISGAGISQPAGLPDFRGLVLEVYRRIDPAVHSVLDSINNAALPPSAYAVVNSAAVDNEESLSPSQKAEVRRFGTGDYDVVLGMLERRMDGRTLEYSRVRRAVADILTSRTTKPTHIHRALMRLSDRGGVTTTLTTNFELLLEKATPRSQRPIPSHSLSGIPRPGRNHSFSGVLHIHGALTAQRSGASNLVLTDHDFGEFYLRRRVVPDLIYDAARLFHLVLVGYSANDAPMRYLLNAVAADGFRFDDLKERFAFVGEPSPPDPVRLEDWKGRGITPISYSTEENHAAVRATLVRWAALGAKVPNLQIVNSEIRRIVRNSFASASETDRDLFEHLVRRAGSHERGRIALLATQRRADLGWLDAINRVSQEPHGRNQ